MKVSNIIIVITALIFIGCEIDESNSTSKANIKKLNKKVYTGGWPFNPNKDLIDDPGFGNCPKANGCECNDDYSCPDNSACTQLFRGKYCIPKKGSVVPRFKGFDQFGEEFDLYDLSIQGKPILLEVGSSTAQSSQDFSAWRSHQNDNATRQKWWKNKFSGVRDLIDNEEVLWVHIIHLDENKNSATIETVSSWHERYPHDNIIILADPEAKMKTWIRPTGLPCMVLLDENMILQVHTLRGIEDAIDGVYEMLGSK